MWWESFTPCGEQCRKLWLCLIWLRSLLEWKSPMRSLGTRQSLNLPFFFCRLTRLPTQEVASPSSSFVLMSFLTISSSSLLMSHLRLIGTRRGGWIAGGTLGSTVMRCSPWNFPMPLKHSGYYSIRSCLSLIRVVSLACSRVLSFGHPWLLVCECCVWIAQLNCSRFRSGSVRYVKETGSEKMPKTARRRPAEIWAWFEKHVGAKVNHVLAKNQL